eukprot:jgi/Botrbrau1/344/Bobra.110_2s0003.1
MSGPEQNGNGTASTQNAAEALDATVGLPAAAVQVQERVNLALHKGHSVCLVLDYGSQYTQLIARRIRENGVYSMLMPGDATLERIKEVGPKAIILSGGPNSVHVEGAPQVPGGFFEYCRDEKIPVLGICYGMQLIVQTLGGEVKEAEAGGEYGRMAIRITHASQLYANEPEAMQLVWMSHWRRSDTIAGGL